MTRYRHPIEIVFRQFNGQSLKDVEHITVIDLDDPAVEMAAARLANRGHFLFSADLRSLAPVQCLQSAVRDQTNVVILIPKGFVNPSTLKYVAKISGRKRPASNELVEEQRPRKFWIADTS